MLITYLILTRIFSFNPTINSNSLVGRLHNFVVNQSIQDTILRCRKGIITLILFLVSSSFAIHTPTDELVLVKTMIARTKSIQSMSYEMRKTERFENEMVVQKSFIKWTRKPFQVHITQLEPNNGLEVVFIQNKNNNKAQINPNGFPWVSLNLNPQHKKMRKKQHHTLYESGFDYFISILEHMINKYNSEMDTMLAIRGQVDWQNIKCWEVVISNPHFSYINYTVNTKDETVLTIAKKFKVSEYMILEKNKNLKSYTAVVPGQTLVIPNDYSPKITLYIDQKTLIPCQIIVEDEKGLFEKYEMTSLKIYPDVNSNVIAFK